MVANSRHSVKLCVVCKGIPYCSKDARKGLGRGRHKQECNKYEKFVILKMNDLIECRGGYEVYNLSYNELMDVSTVCKSMRIDRRRLLQFYVNN
ncbi:hypothetical protein CHS0354_012019 [Potamilus streckersoni]|uniref:Uncharacterized protein n=1 Tax=Potamilus streckersoni TaxID=2493646 RepID=A0AAE0VJY1_9BIVA|nr:hypothetical protein CHS0354_012019 [Potamilus streckersoni]